MTKGNIKIKDPYGFAIVFLICAILWYKEVVQQLFFQVNGAFMALGIILTAVVVLDNFSRRGNNRLLNLPGAANTFFLVFVLAFVIGLVMAPSYQSHLDKGVSVMEYALVMMYVCYYVSTRYRVETLIWNYLAIYLFMIVMFFISPVSVENGRTMRYTLKEDMNPNGFATGLVTGIWAALYLVLYKRIRFWLGVAFCGAALYAIFLSGSKKGLIGALLIIVLWIAVCYLPGQRECRATIRVGAFLGVVLAVALLYLVLRPLFFQSVVYDRLSRIDSDQSTLVRMDMYRAGIEYFKHSPWFGYGFWGFAYYYGYYSHSTVIEMLVSCGLPLTLAYLFGYVLTGASLIKGVRAYKLKPDHDPKRIADGKMMLILFINYIVSVIYLIHIYDLGAFINFGMMIATGGILMGKRGRQDERKVLA